MGDTNKRILEVENLINEKWPTLWGYHRENAIKIKNFALILAKLGKTQQSKMLIYRACNDWRTDFPTKKETLWEKLKKGVQKWLDTE